MSTAVVDSLKAPKIAIAAGIITILLAVSTAIQAFTAGSLTELIPLPVLIIGAIGIFRRTAWSAYGLALYEASGLVVLAIAEVRNDFRLTSTADAGAAIIAAAIGVVYFMAGRSLEASGAPKGRRGPWIALAMLVAVPFLFLQPFIVPTGAMENTLLIGDRILVKPWPATTPKRGDIIAYRYPGDPQTALIKRIVGIPGDRIKVVNKQLLVNGEAVSETYVVHKTDYIDSYRDNFPGEPSGRMDPAGRDMLQHHVSNGEVVVPDGNYFVLGDSRDVSLDSRYTGFIPRANIIGSPLIVYWSEEAAGENKRAPGAIRWSRVFRRI